MQSVKAVISITRRFLEIHSWKVMSFKLFGIWYLFRVGSVDAVYPGAFQDDIGVDLNGSERAGRIGCKIRIAGTGAENDHAALFHVADGPTADIGFGDLLHFDGALQGG